MSNPRDALDFVGIRPLRVTMTIDNSSITADADEDGGSSSVGLAMTLAGDAVVATAASGEVVIGKLISVNVASSDPRCTVQVGGFMELPAGANYGGSPGDQIVGDVNGSAAEGYIMDMPDASAGSAAEINAAAKARGTVYDDSTTTAIVVHLPG